MSARSQRVVPSAPSASVGALAGTCQPRGYRLGDWSIPRIRIAWRPLMIDAEYRSNRRRAFVAAAMIAVGAAAAAPFLIARGVLMLLGGAVLAVHSPAASLRYASILEAWNSLFDITCPAAIVWVISFLTGASYF